MIRFCLLAWCCSGFLACSGGVEQKVGPDTDAGPGVDVAVEVILKTDVVEVVDLLHQDDANDISVEVVGPQCSPGEGCFLDKCSKNSDCDSGWCVDNMGEGVCTKLCEEECPPGWTCAQIAGSAPDIVFACVSNHANLCRPCTTGKDCESLGGAEDVCVAYGDAGSFCGGSCSDTDSCPYGFSCQKALTVDGIETTQCVAVSGLCPCTKKSVDLSLWTSCAQSSEWGKCIGKRVCKEEGLSDCDAAAPAEEVCDGEDNDCDGDMDEPDLIGGKYHELCDDSNDCTDDTCTGTDGCVNEVLDSGACDDDNPCTVADHCEAGNCTGTTVECDDQNPCTENVCTETGGCSFPPATGPCDDDNPCTLADQCQDSQCAGVEMPCDCQDDQDCAALEDGDLCNGTLACDKSKLPYHCAVKEGTVVVCPGPPAGPDAFCLAAACDTLSGLCSLEPDHEGLFCDDGDACTVNDKCVQGACVAGMPLNCNDGNSCTDDACEVKTGCASTPNNVPCDDGDVCTSQDKCADGKCVGGPALGCDDGNPCSSDSCAPGEGCLHQDVDGACDDGDACTTGDSCVAGICKGSGQLDCDDGKVCTTDGCDAAAGCVYKLNQAPCDDGNVCTYGDHCHLGECISSSLLVCNDGNPCTDDSCSPQVGCQFTPNVAPCDDGNACTEKDKCAGGWCLAGAMLDCDDGNECTDDQCVPGAGCVHEAVADGTPCIGGQAWSCVQGICACKPQTCEALGKECAVWPDGCGGETVDCGQCGPDEVCGAGGKCVCKTIACADGCCPLLAGYDISCNAQAHCEYANQDVAGWKKWDVWILVGPGTFQMGTPGGGGSSSPAHAVTFAYGFLISKYEATVVQYEACMQAKPAQCTAPSSADFNGGGWGTNTSANGRSVHPQNGLAWQQAKSFCNWAALGGRLPSEAEWEFAASGPVPRKYPWGDGLEPTCANGTAVFNEAGGVAGYGCGQGGTWKVGEKMSGASWSGALDMGGNVWEWCEDWYHSGYAGAPENGSAWLDPVGASRVLRGGSFPYDAGPMQSASRNYYGPGSRNASVGVRCVRPLPGDCIPDCVGKECGEDGCGGSCGICDDNKDCTADNCLAAGTCQFLPNAAVCDDGNECTQDVCDAQVGCKNSAVSDGTACTTAEIEAGKCKGGVCVVPSCPDGPPCSAFSPCKAGGAYAGFYWVAAHSGHNCQKACELIGRTCTTAGSAVITDAAKMYAAFAAAGYAKGGSNALDRQWCTPSIENSPAAYLFDNTATIQTGYYDSTGTVCSTFCSNTWNLNEGYHHLCSCL